MSNHHLASTNNSAAPAKIATTTTTTTTTKTTATPVSYIAYEEDIRRFGEHLFPADLVWNFFAIPEPTSAADILLGLAQSTARDRTKATLREWRMGDDESTPLIDTAERLRELFTACKTGRFAAGPVRIGPGLQLKTTPIVNKQFVIDLDATDYKEVRAACGCGEAKAKLCPLCIKVIRTVARLAVDILEMIFLCKRVYCFFSGGRGIHIRALDYEICLLTTEQRRYIADTIQNALSNPALTDLCKPLRALSEEHKFKRLVPLIDYQVTVQMKKMTRAPYSVHERTGRISVPIASPEAFTSVEAVSPTIGEVLQSARKNPRRQCDDARWLAAIRLFQDWVTTA